MANSPIWLLKSPWPSGAEAWRTHPGSAQAQPPPFRGAGEASVDSVGESVRALPWGSLGTPFVSQGV